MKKILEDWPWTSGALLVLSLIVIGLTLVGCGTSHRSGENDLWKVVKYTQENNR